MPFTRFILPVAQPRLWGIFGIAAVLIAFQIIDGILPNDLGSSCGLTPSALRSEPWRLITWCLVQAGWIQAAGNAVGLGVGLTMTARCSGKWPTWIGLAGAVVLPALWAWHDMDPDASLVGASTLLYGALGMGSVAWLKMRDELTYTERSDWVAGFAALLLVGFALSIPLLLEAPARWIHVIGFTWGFGVVLFFPRT
ncbi:MAG: rhomboid family intramembrane serine protease [Myxococcota bacterium]|nr:rhomboid family intramembrane serine protease [Myxococcota bacterium]